MSDRGDLTRDVLLRVRGENLSTASFTQVSAAVKALTADLDNQVAAANRAAISERELSAQITKLEQASRNLSGIATAIDRFKNFDAILKTAEADLERARTKLSDYRTTLETSNDTSAKAERQLGQLVKGYERAETVLNSQRQAYTDLSQRLNQAGIDTNNLATAENNLRTTATETGVALTRLNQAKLDYAANSRIAREAIAAEAAERKRLADIAKAEASAIELTRAARQQEAGELRSNLSAMMAANREQVAAERAKFEAMQASVVRFNEDSRAAARQRVSESTAAARVEVAAARAAFQQRAADQRAFYDAQVAQLRAFNEQTRQLNRQRSNDAANAAVASARAGLQQPAPHAPGVAPHAPATGAAGQVGIFGLRPSAVGNLAYQVNDVVSGLAMGQNIGQIFAQQIGQIAQLFPRFNTLVIGALRLLPALAVAAVAVAVAIGGINRVLREAASTREFNAALTLNADGATRSVAELNKLRKTVRDLGVDWKEAGEIIKIGINAGLTGDALAAFTKASRDISDVTGAKVPEAMQNLVDSFTKGFAAIEKLDDAQNFLTADQYKNIKSLFEQGKGAEGAARAFEIYKQKISDAQKDGVSPFTESMRGLSRTWDNFLITVGNSTFISALVDGLTGLLTIIDRTVAGIDKLIEKKKLADTLSPSNILSSGLGFAGDFLRSTIGLGSGPGATVATGTVPPPIPESASAIYGRQANVKIDSESLARLEALIIAGAQSAKLPPGYKVVSTSGQRDNAVVADTGDPSEHGFHRAIDIKIVDDKGRDVPGAMGGGGPLYRQLDAAIEALAREQGRTVAIGTRFTRKPDAGHYSEGGEEAARQATKEGADNADLQQKATEKRNKDLEKTNKLVQDLQDKDKTANEAAQRKLDFEQAYTELKDKGRSDEAATIYANAVADQAALLRQRTRAAEKRQDEIRSVTAGADEEKVRAAGEAERRKASAEGVENEGELRRRQLDAENLIRAQITQREKELSEVKTATNQLASLARQNELKNTTDIEARVKAVNDQYVSFLANLAKLQRDFPNNTQISGLREQATKEQGEATERATMQGHLAKLNALQADRNALVSTYNTLVEKGIVTQGEAEDKIKAAYDRTGPAIAAATEEANKFAASAKNIDPTQLDLFNAKVKEVAANAKYISPLMKSIKEAVENSFSTGLSTAFNTVAEAVGGLINKTKTWGDVLKSAKTAAANFFAQLLKDIATAIIKYEALKLVSSLGFGGSGGLGSLLGLGGTTATTATAGTAAAQVATPAVVLHRGGVAGSVPATRSVPASWWQNAPRYHNGTPGVGWGPDEVGAVLKRGEEVLTQDNPRHIRNWMGGGGETVVQLRNVLVDDRARIPEAMTSAHGERVIVDTLVRNAATVRQIAKG